MTPNGMAVQSYISFNKQMFYYKGNEMRRIYTYILWVSLLYVSCVFICCDNDCTSENTPDNYNNPTVPVTVTLSGTFWNAEQSSNGGVSASKTVKVPVGNNSLTATLEPSPGTQTRATALTTGVRYRIVAYAANDISATGYVNHADYVVGGTTPSFLLPVNCSYTFVCYSYGTTTVLPNFDKNSTTMAANPETADLMYCKKNVTVTKLEKSFSVVFSHLFSKVTVIVEGSGKNITACSGYLTPSYQATVSLVDGSLVKGSSVTGTVNWPSLGTTTVTSNPILVNTNAEEVSLTLSSITLGSKTLTNQSIAFTGKTMESGKNYTLRVIFKYKPSGAIEVTGSSVYWAPGNLIYSPGKFQFASTQDYYSGKVYGNDYWCWNYLSCNPYEYPRTDYDYNSDYDSRLDPCTIVAPAGTWRMPTQDEFKTFLSLDHVHVFINNIYIGISYGTDQETNIIDNRFVFLPPAGMRHSSGYMVDVGSKFAYWTATRITGYQQVYFANEVVGNFAGRDYGMSIRCVSGPVSGSYSEVSGKN